MSERILTWLLAGAVLALTGCSSKAPNKPKLAEMERVPRLETIASEKRPTLRVTRDFTATVEALEKAELVAQVRGVVQSPNVEIGRRVRGERFAPETVGGGIALLSLPHGAGPLLATALIMAGRQEGEALVVLAIPDVLADRENKRALLELAREARGQAVRARDVAAEEVKESEAQQKRFQADVEYRDAQYQRVMRLVTQDTLQKQMADEARLQHKAALAAQEAAGAQTLTKQARLLAAEGEIKVAESKVKVARAELDRLNAMVGFATIRAPFDGVVTKRWVDRGAIVKDFGTPLLTVMRTDMVRVLIDVPERDVPYIRAAGAGKPGNPVELRIPALADKVPGGKFPGEVTYIASSLDPTTRTMRAEILIPNRAGYLKPQMTGTANVVLEERTEVFVVPASAIVRQAGKVSVFHIADAKGSPPRGVVRRADLEVGMEDGLVVEVRRGLTGTEQIITKGNGVVREGDFAIPVPTR